MALLFEKNYKNTDPAKIRTFQEIENAAAGLTDEEVLAMYGLTYDELVTDADKADFKMATLRGRATAKRKAIDHLFNQMANTRGGKEACMEYLQRFGKDWTNEPDFNF